MHRIREPLRGPARSIAQGGRRAGNPWGDTVLVPAGTLARHARPTGAGLDVMRGLACAPIWSPGEPPPRDHRTLRRQLEPGAQPAETPLQPISPSPDARAGDSAGREAHRGSGGSSRVILPQERG